MKTRPRQTRIASATASPGSFGEFEGMDQRDDVEFVVGEGEVFRRADAELGAASEPLAGLVEEEGGRIDPRHVAPLAPEEAEVLPAAAPDVEEPLPRPGRGQVEDEALDPPVEIAAGGRRPPVVMDGFLFRGHRFFPRHPDRWKAVRYSFPFPLMAEIRRRSGRPRFTRRSPASPSCIS